METKLLEEIEKLKKALAEYADPDNWRAPNGGGAENIFKWEEKVSFNGYDIAEKALAEDKI